MNQACYTTPQQNASSGISRAQRTLPSYAKKKKTTYSTATLIVISQVPLMIKKSRSGKIFTWTKAEILANQEVVNSHTVISKSRIISTTSTSCKAIWLRRIFQDVTQNQEAPTKICYNMSAIAMTVNTVFQARTKHIEIQHHSSEDS